MVAAKTEALTQPLPSTTINSMLLAPFSSKKSFKSGLVKQEARRFSKIREDTTSKPVANFFFLSFLPRQGHTRIFDLCNLNFLHKRRPRSTVRTTPQIFRGIIFTILTHKCRLFLCDDKPLSKSLSHIQSLGKNQSSHLVQTGASAFRELQ